MDTQPAFKIDVVADGSLHISGAAAAMTVLRLALAAKFQTELKWDHLLSPFVNQIIDELTKVLPLEPEDWSNPAVLTPPEFLEAVEVMRTYHRVHEPEAELSELVRIALNPFIVSAERLGLNLPAHPHRMAPLEQTRTPLDRRSKRCGHRALALAGQSPPATDWKG